MVSYFVWGKLDHSKSFFSPNFLAIPQSIWDPSAQTRDQTHAPALETWSLTTGPPEKSPGSLLKMAVFIDLGKSRVGTVLMQKLWISSSVSSGAMKIPV